VFGGSLNHGFQVFRTSYPSNWGGYTKLIVEERDRANSFVVDTHRPVYVADQSDKEDVVF
jgi:hypothetical protein